MLFLEIPLFRKKRFWGPKTWNFMKLHEFHPFSLIFPIWGHFSGSWIFCVVGYFPGLCFKAEIQTFRELFRVLRKMELFGSKTWILPKISFRGGKTPLGLQKRAQNLTFIKGFARGARLGSKTPKWAEFHVLGPKRGSLPPKRVDVRFWLSIS